MKFSIRDIFSKFDHIRSFLRIYSHLLKISFLCNMNIEQVFAYWNTGAYLGQIFKSGLIKFCGRQPLRNFKGYGLFKQTISLEFF